MYEYALKEVTRVVDGDTIDVVFDLGFNIFLKERVRLAGIDSPESRTRNLEEKELGLQAKKKLEQELDHAKLIVVQTKKDKGTGKYGRILGWLYLDGAAGSLNQELIDQGYAWPYEGGTKHTDLEELRQKRRKSFTS
jgi:micrococcal nuclease